MTALDSDTGARTGARTSDADDAVNLAGGSGYVLAQGRTRLETWGTNLVRGIEYGRVDAPVKPTHNRNAPVVTSRQRCWAPTGSPSSNTATTTADTG